MDWLWTSIGGLVAILFIKFLWPFLLSVTTDWVSKKATEHLAKKKDDFVGQMLRSLNSVSAVDSPPVIAPGINKEQFEEEIEKINRKLDLIVKLVSPVVANPPIPAKNENTITEEEDIMATNKPISITEVLEKEEIDTRNPMQAVAQLMQNKELMQSIFASFGQLKTS